MKYKKIMDLEFSECKENNLIEIFSDRLGKTNGEILDTIDDIQMKKNQTRVKAPLLKVKQRVVKRNLGKNKNNFHCMARY